MISHQRIDISGVRAKLSGAALGSMARRCESDKNGRFSRWVTFCERGLETNPTIYGFVSPLNAGKRAENHSFSRHGRWHAACLIRNMAAAGAVAKFKQSFQTRAKAPRS
jgi:hypothetical protein